MTFVTLGLAAAAPPPASSRPTPDAASPAPAARVIVQSSAGAAAAAAAVRHRGGRVTRSLDLVHGVAAVVPPGALAALVAAPGLSVTPDRAMRVQADAPAPPPAGTSAYRDVVGAAALQAAGHRGQGVTVAVIDTGIAAVPDLAGRITPVRDHMTMTTAPCLDLSGERTCADTYGHGTFMAGIIAGSGASSGGRYAGVAPSARLLSVKVAGRDGSADVSTVLSAIQWVVSFKDHYGIDVLNLSLGTDSTQTYRTDPLNYAVERAWASGITVVVAASNRGPSAGTVSKPGDDPFVVTVGAIDDRGTTDPVDDHIPDFSSRGPTAADGLAKPDVAAPGAHLVSLTAPGSDLASNFPSSLGSGYRSGSGTSMATAVVSGVSALIVGADPTITPDRLKFALMASARPTVVADPMATGAGVVDAVAALVAPAGTANGGLARSNGMGSLDASRGSVRVRTQGPFGSVLSGLRTAQLLLWDPLGFTTGTWGPTSWYTSSLYTSSWRAVTWEGSKWQGSKWQGSKWQGGADAASSYGSKWQGADWYGAWG